MHGSSGEFSNPYEGQDTAGLRHEDFMFRAVQESGLLNIERASRFEDITGKTDFKIGTDEGEKVRVQFKTRDLSTQQRLDLIKQEIIPITADENQVNYAKKEQEWRVYVLNEFVGQFNAQLPLWRRIYYHQGNVSKEDVERALRLY